MISAYKAFFSQSAAGSRVPIITALGVRSEALMRPSLKGPREAVILTSPENTFRVMND